MDVDAVVEAIEQGHFDGQLAAITQALRERHQSSAVEMCWKVEFAGLEITEESLTIAELDAIERMLTTKDRLIFYPQLSPLVSAQHATALLMTVLTHRLGYDNQRAHDALKQHTMRSLQDAFSEYEVKRPPKGGPAISS